MKTARVIPFSSLAGAPMRDRANSFSDASEWRPRWAAMLGNPTGLWILFSLLVALVWGPRLFRSFWTDEAGTYWMVHDGPIAALQKTAHWPGQSLLYSFIASFFCFGQWPLREFLLRIPSVIGTLIACYFVYRLAEEAIGKGAGMMATFFFALSPPGIMVATYARPYGLAVAAACGSTCALYRWHMTRERRYLVQYSIASLLVIYLHYLFVFLFLGHVVYAGFVWVAERRRERWFELLAAYAVIGLATLPLAWHLHLLFREASTLPASEPPTLDDLATWLVQPLLAFGVLLAALGVQAFCRPALKKVPPIARAFAMLLLAWWFLGPLAIGLVSKFTPMRMFVPRYLTYSTPALALLFAVGGYSAFGISLGRVWALVAIALSTASPSEIVRSIKPGPDELRPAIQIVRQESIGAKPPLFFLSGLQESQFQDWRNAVNNNSYMLAPLTAYPVSNHVFPLPLVLTDDAKQYLTHVIGSDLKSENKVLFFGNGWQWWSWVIDHMRDAGFDYSLRRPNNFSVLVFTRKSSGTP